MTSSSNAKVQAPVRASRIKTMLALIPIIAFSSSVQASLIGYNLSHRIDIAGDYGGAFNNTLFSDVTITDDDDLIRYLVHDSFGGSLEYTLVHDSSLQQFTITLINSNNPLGFADINSISEQFTISQGAQPQAPPDITTTWNALHPDPPNEPVMSLVNSTNNHWQYDSSGNFRIDGGETASWTYNYTLTSPLPQVPVPAALWLFGSGLLGLVGIARRKKV